MNIKERLVCLSFFVYFSSCFGAYQVCFTPGQYCTGEIIREIDKAQRSILVQAYSFTSVPIINALIVAKGRGVDVEVILDKSQCNRARQFTGHQIPARIDSRIAIAHNKVMVIDEKIVITGSFNFTKAAQYKNAENVLIIHDRKLATAYAANWQRRLLVSKLAP